MASNSNWVRDDYETAQICENGHVVNSSTRSRPANNKAYCPKCGARTITKCPTCSTRILGTNHYQKSGHAPIPYTITKPPSYCHSCGAAYPWTEFALQVVQEAAENYLSPEDADIVKRNLPDIASDTPRTALAAQKVRQAIDKGGQPMREAVKVPLLLLVASSARAIFAWIST
jgi:hypothetical protein